MELEKLDSDPSNVSSFVPNNQKEKQLSLLGQIFLSNVLMYLKGRKTNLKLRGSQAEITALSNALSATKKFQEEMDNSKASVDSVIQSLIKKKDAAAQFEMVFGIKWPV